MIRWSWLLCLVACHGGDIAIGVGGFPGEPVEANPTDEGPLEDEVEIEAADGVLLHAVHTRLRGVEDAPGILFLHQFGLDGSQWDEWAKTQAERGYQVLSLDLRGHGSSGDYEGESTELLTDPSGAPLDVAAALAWMKGEGAADPDRLAVVGTSVGANLAVGASVIGSARTYVAISPRLEPTEALAGQEARGMSSVMYVAGALDAGGQAADCETLYDRTGEPRALLVIPEVADHGVELIGEPYDVAGETYDVTEEVTAWLDQTL